MRKVYYTFLIYVLAGTASGQTKFFPSGIVLYPYEKIAQGSWPDSIKRFVVKAEIDAKTRIQFIPKSLAENWKIIREHELEIMANQNFYSFLSLSIDREIIYRLLENNSNLLIYAVKDSMNASLPDYRKILLKQGVSWLVNPHRVTLSEVNGKKIIQVDVQCYYNPTGFLPINTSLKVTEDEVQGKCEGGIINCMLTEVVNKIATISVDRINRTR